MVNRVDVKGSGGAGGGLVGTGRGILWGYLQATCQIAIDSAEFLAGYG